MSTPGRILTGLRRCSEITLESHDTSAEVVALLVPMEDLLEALGVPTAVRRERHELSLVYRGSGPCPLHEESNPTDFSWSTDGSWRCSACGRKGGKIGLIHAIRKKSTERETFTFLAKVAAQVSPFKRFVQYSEAEEATRKLLGRLSNAGCNNHLIFEFLRSYLENREDSRAQRKALGLKHRSRINRLARERRLIPEEARRLLARTHAGFDARRLGVSRLVANLYALTRYIETKTGERRSIDHLCLLIEAARVALMRWRLSVTPDAVRHELDRFVRRNESSLIPLIETHITHL